MGWPLTRLQICSFRATKNAGFSPASLFNSFSLYGLLGAAGVFVDGVGLVPKSTVGGASVPAAASKYVRAFAPVTFAVIACGNVRM